MMKALKPLFITWASITSIFLMLCYAAADYGLLPVGHYWKVAVILAGIGLVVHLCKQISQKLEHKLRHKNGGR